MEDRPPCRQRPQNGIAPSSSNRKSTRAAADTHKEAGQLAVPPHRTATWFNGTDSGKLPLTGLLLSGLPAPAATAGSSSWPPPLPPPPALLLLVRLPEPSRARLDGSETT